MNASNLDTRSRYEVFTQTSDSSGYNTELFVILAVLLTLVCVF